MKILVLARGCPNVQDSVYGNFEYEQAVALSKMGIDVIYAYIDRRIKTGYKRSLGLSSQSGYPFPVYGGFLTPFPLRPFVTLSTWLYKRRFKRLFKIIVEKEGVPDLIHCHYLFNLPCAEIIKKKYNIKIVETEHWSEVNTPCPRPHIRKLSSYYKCADKIISVSESLRNSLFNNFNIESVCIYNMVSGTFFERSHSRKKKGTNKVSFVSIGYLRYLKGFDLLIEAFSGIGTENKGWELTICGDGTERPKLERLIKEKGLENNIHLAGRKGKEEIREILMSSDIFVLPSRSETFGVVFIEAMACGLPVIATKCGGPEEFVTTDVGMLIDKDNVPDLREAIIDMMQHLSDYNSDYIRHICYNMFSPEKIAAQYIDVYKDLLR